jgi:hypothetical protein
MEVVVIAESEGMRPPVERTRRARVAENQPLAVVLECAHRVGPERRVGSEG